MKNKKIVQIMLVVMLLATDLLGGIVALAEIQSIEVEETQTIAEITDNIDEEEVVSEQEEIVGINSEDEIEVEEQIEAQEAVSLSENNLGSTRETGIREVAKEVLPYPLGAPRATREKIIHQYTDVYIDGKKATKDEYILNYRGVNDYDYFAGTTDLEEVTFTAKSSGRRTPDSYRTYLMVYGSSLVFDSSEKNSIAGAFTLHTDAPEWTITGRPGTDRPDRGKESQVLVNDKYMGQDYYKIEVLRPKPGVPASDPSTEVVKSLTAKGSDRKEDVLKEWQSVVVQPGDVVRTWTANPENNEWYRQFFHRDKIEKENNTDENGVAYYSVRKGGYWPYTFVMPEDEPRLTTKRRTVMQGATKEELDEGIEQSFVEVPEYAEILGFKDGKYPDTSQPGEVTAKIEVKEESLNKPDTWITYVYDAPFRVLEKEVIEPTEELDVHLVEEPSIPVGTNPEEMDIYSLIDYVSYNGHILDESEFDAKFIWDDYGYDDNEKENPFFGKYESARYSDVKYTIEVSLKKDESIKKRVEKDKVVLKMAHSVSVEEPKTVSSVSLLEKKNKTPYLRATRGKTISENASPRYNEIYSELGVYRGNEETELAKVKTKNNDSIFEVVNRWNGELKKYDQDARYGDVIKQTSYRIGQKDPLDGRDIYTTRLNEQGREVGRREARFNKDGFQAELSTDLGSGYGFQDVYYELTPNGYNLLRLNQGITFDEKNLKIKEDMSQDSINEQLAYAARYPKHFSVLDPDYQDRVRFELKNVDTTTLGKKKGTVEIYEHLETGGEFMIKQDVTYEVVETLNINLKPMTIPVGTKAELITADDFIDSVYYGKKKLSPSEYVATIDNKVDTMKVGENGVIIKVEMKGKDEFRGGVTQANVIWGDSVVSKRADGTTGTSISLLHDNNKPYLRANEGTGFEEDANLQLRPFTYVYRNNTSNLLLTKEESGYGGADNPMADTMDKWNQAFESKNFQYGDVLGFRIDKYKQKNESEMGTNTWISRKEELVKETEGYDQAYYEMTKDGYRLLHFNQLVIKDAGLTFDVGETQTELDAQASSIVEFPKHVTNQSDFEFKFYGINTTRPGTNLDGTLEVYEKLATGGKFMGTYPIKYAVEQRATVKVKENTIPVGTKKELINAKDYVEGVYENDVKLDPKDYEVTLDNSLNTQKVGNQPTKVIVDVKGSKIISETTTHIVWGSTIATKNGKGPALESSISLLNNEGNPYLAANEGTGLANITQLSTRIDMKFYRHDTVDGLLYRSFYKTVGQSPKSLMERWNSDVDGVNQKELQYGDVMSYSVSNNNSVNVKGENTWLSRNEELVKETIGYDTAYYEMTKDGFRLMHFNQLQANDKIPVVKLNETLAEMNKKASEAVIIPNHIKDPERFRFEYVSVDTETSGIKTSKMNVYEKLSAGKEFKTTIDVQYQVNPQMKEMFYDQKGNRIQVSRITDFDLGSSYQPVPDKFISSGADVYIYKGWLNGSETPGIDTPRDGQPEKATKETVVHYIYEKADNYINMTVPTEMIFGTEINGKDITSKDYAIKNNSKEVATEVTLKEFKKESSEVKLLTKKDSDPKNEDKSARLNLMINGSEAINSLSDSSKNEPIAAMMPGEQGFMSMGGKYFGSKSESAKVKYHMQLQFKAKGD